MSDSYFTERGIAAANEDLEDDYLGKCEEI